MDIGPRLRALRTGHVPPLTLAELAGETLSVALVSKIERGLVNPSLGTLRYLAGRLGVSLAALFDDGAEGAAELMASAHDAARARLLLGDPAGAAGEAVEAAAQLRALPSLPAGASEGVLRARLLGVAAEATFFAGQASAAARFLMEASEAAAAIRASTQVSLVEAELAWVLGLLERRRGALAEAERTHTGALGGLEGGTPAHPWWQYLRASVLAELGGLAEARGDFGLGRDLVARGASIAAGVAQAAVPAQALLAEWSVSTAAPPTRHPGRSHASAPSAAAAFVLAVTAAADRLAHRLAQEAARLERAAASPHLAGTPPAFPDASHSRHLA